MFDVVVSGAMVMRMKRVSVRYSRVWKCGVRSGFVL